MAGNIKNIDLKIDTSGFTAKLDWWVICQRSSAEDKIFPNFIKPDLIKAKLSIDRTFDKVGTKTEPMILTGLVTEKALEERSFGDVYGEPVLHRRYTIEFSDIAQVLWKQHFPTALWVDKSWKQIFMDNVHKDMKFTYTWTKLNTKHPVLSLGLGEGKASFYDFMIWLLRSEYGSLFYDLNQNKYELGSKKKTIGKEQEVSAEDVELVETVFLPTPRHKTTILNSYSEKPKTKDVTNKYAEKVIVQNRLFASQVASHLTARETLEKNLIKPSEPHLLLKMGRYPSFTIRPGMLMSFKEQWSSKHIFSSKKYRVLSNSIVCHALEQGGTKNDGDESNKYEISFESRLEEKGDPVFHYPDFVTPSWPFFVEGKVLSEEGSKKEDTYQFYSDKGTSIDYYKVKVPLWKNDKVIAPYDANIEMGNHYFPLYKDERVVLALYFQHARIDRCIDWRAGVRLPKETQGNHILLGKTDKSKTSIRHVYEDKKPTLNITRLSEKDTQVIEVKEGRIMLETQELKK
ncbi:MAG: hypothetical protein VYC39_07055 [Myxococcota bacterium]|nr:hypothetical protein [Myxococcota bacterium]